MMFRLPLMAGLPRSDQSKFYRSISTDDNLRRYIHNIEISQNWPEDTCSICGEFAGICECAVCPKCGGNVVKCGCEL